MNRYDYEWREVQGKYLVIDRERGYENPLAAVTNKSDAMYIVEALNHLHYRRGGS